MFRVSNVKYFLFQKYKMSFSVDKKLSEPKKREAPWILNNDTKRARLDDSNSPNSFEENLKSSENSSVERRESDKECALSNQDISKTPAQPNFVKIKRSSSKKPGGRFRKCGGNSSNMMIG